MARADGRTPSELRAVTMTPGFHRLSEGSVLYRAGGTVVLATASIDTGVPPFLEGKGTGWLTAEYQMHPRSNPKRRENRDGRGKAPSGRTQEIQRLVGRALRSAVHLDRIGVRTITVDCDVLEADGGTRTASVTAGFVAMALGVSKLMARGDLAAPVIRDQVASVSVGHVDDALLLDLAYVEDSRARVDLNLVATDKAAVIEVQGTAEGVAVPRADIDRMIDLGLEGIASLCELQRRALKEAGVDLQTLIAS
jgi:ribonuclease PH